MKKISTLLIYILLIGALPLFSSGTIEENEKPLVAVSILPQATFAREIGGDKIDIITLIPKGSSPENYELSPKERATFEKSNLYFSIGVQSEKYSILPFVQETTKVVNLSEIVKQSYPELKIGSERDPHIWLSPKRAAIMVNSMAENISALDEENRDYYMKRANSYILKIQSTDKEISKILESCKDKDFIIYHPAFGYFASDYNLNMLAIENEGKEATAQYLTKLITTAKEKNIKNIFYQAEIASSQSETFAKELGGRAIRLDPLNPSYLENMITMAKKFKENI